jgi:subtilisin family serine protease
VEDLSYSVTISETYSIGIRRRSATSNHRLELYSDFHDLSPAVAVSSLLSPADAEGALTVGAVGYRNWTTGPIQYFSSQGPTNDNRIKPDISGPDGVSNYIYGNFFGTSASCAHVSGAAAIILAKNSGYSAAQLRSVLTSTAIDMGSAGRDSLYGYGRLNLDINATADSSSDGNDDDGGGGGCFIATAAYDAPVTLHFHTLQLLIFGCTLIGITILAKNTIKIGRKNTQTDHFRL